MPPSFIQKSGLIFLLGCALIFAATIVYLFRAFDGLARQPAIATPVTNVSQALF